jgi:tetratricopeptide (TPR) repeat protein
MRALRLIALLLAAASVSAAVPLPSEKDQWIALSAGELRIYSNASERATKEIGTNLLRMRAAIGKVTRLNVHSPLPTYVVVFRNERSFAPYRDALVRQRNATVSGLFLSSSVGNFIVMDAAAEGGVDRVVYHELAHYFVRNTTAGLPLWFDEGMAEYYSSFAVDGEKISIGRPIPEHVYWLREYSLLPLARHFAVTQSSPEYSEGTRQGSFYAQSWALVHYLLTGGEETRRQLGQFLANIGAGQSNEEAFRGAFGNDFGALEQDLRSYLRKPSMTFTTYKVTDLSVPEVAAPRAVSRDELLYVLGLLYAFNRGSQSDAELLLQEAIRVNARNAEAHAILGYLKSYGGNEAAATALYEKAVDLGTREAAVYLIYATTVIQRGQSRENLLRARQLFERAVELEPNNARAWSGIGFTYVGETDDPAPGIAALEKSLALAASDDETALNLIQLYADTGRRDDARRLYDTRLARSSNPQYVTMAREAVFFADVRVAEKLWDAGQYAEAVELVRPIAAQTTNASLRQHLEGMIARHDELETRLRQAETIREIVEKANGGRKKEALALLDELLPQITDETMKKELEKMRKTLAGK